MAGSSSSTSHSSACRITPEVISVRRALMTPVGEMNQLFIITGVVSSVVELHTNFKDEGSNDDEASSYRPSKRFRAEMVLNTVRKCQVTLRDRKHSDTITFYAPYSATSSLTEQSVISITNCKLCLSQGKKKRLYFTLNSDKSLKSKIEICESDKESNGLNSVSKFAFSRTFPCRSLPPDSSLYSLMLTRAYNRCMWTVRGHTTFLKKVFVSLRCSVCCRLCFSSDSQLRFTCRQKCTGSIVTPLWETTIAFDDGTAEADVRLEGDAALYVLRAAGDTQSLGLKHVQHKVDKWVQRTGRFSYDAMSAKYERDMMAAATAEDNEVAFGSDMNSSDEMSKLLDQYLMKCSYLRNFELICSVDHSANSTKDASITTKKVYMQDINSEHPHRVQFSAVMTQTTDKLTLTGLAIRELRSEGLRLTAWDLLTQIEDEYK